MKVGKSQYQLTRELRTGSQYGHRVTEVLALRSQGHEGVFQTVTDKILRKCRVKNVHTVLCQLTSHRVLCSTNGKR